MATALCRAFFRTSVHPIIRVRVDLPARSILRRWSTYCNPLANEKPFDANRNFPNTSKPASPTPMHSRYEANNRRVDTISRIGHQRQNDRYNAKRFHRHFVAVNTGGKAKQSARKIRECIAMETPIQVRGKCTFCFHDDGLGDVDSRRATRRKKRSLSCDAVTTSPSETCYRWNSWS